jgi:putative Mg2+ transporter-C (MgtC) family protein
MHLIQIILPPGFLDTAVGLATAFGLGALIGAERQYRQRTAGLRTNVLVCVGAAGFVDLAMDLRGIEGAVQVISYVVSGIGFLGAGVIMKEGTNIRGLNTAATLWSSAAVGACAGTGRLAEGALLTAFILAGNTLLRPLVNAIDRIPLDEHATEATHEVRVRALSDAPELREAVTEALENARYPVAGVETEVAGDGSAELVATLASSSVKADELDAVVDRISRLPGVQHATWESSTGE